MVFKEPGMVRVYLKPTSIWLYPYEKRSVYSIEKALAIFDFIAKKYISFLYDFEKESERYERVGPDDFGNYSNKKIETGLLKIPRGIGIEYVEDKLKEANIKYTVIDQTTLYPMPKSVSVEMLYKPKDEHQERVFKELKENKASQIFIVLDVGYGKTFSVVNYIAWIKEPALIISFNLSNQWYERILQYTKCTGGSDVLILVGSKILNDIVTKKVKPKAAFYVTTIGTLRSFYQQYGAESLQNLVEVLGIGVKVFDEAHTQFLQFNTLDLNISCRLTIYLTATPGRTTHNNEDRMYKRIYNNIQYIGGYTRFLTNHYNIINVHYSSNPKTSDLSHFKTIRGLKSTFYGRYLFDKYKIPMLNMIKSMMDPLFEKDKTKRCLILLDWLSDIKEAKEYYETLYKDTGITIGTYCLLIPQKEKREEELERNIIFGTLISMQNGRDIKNLQAIFPVIQFSSTIVLHQLMGRLRPLKDAEVYYYNLIDDDVYDIKRQYRLKEQTFIERSKSMNDIVVDLNDYL